MREAVHTNLYSIVNSNAMNGIGENTTVETHDPWPITTVKTVAAVSTVLFVGCFVIWIKKRNKFIQENGKKKDITA